MRLLADFAAQREHAPKRGLEACEQRAAELRVDRQDQVQEMLAVGAAPDRRAMLGGHGVQQTWPDAREVGHRAVVHQREAAVHEGMGVGEADPADRRTAHMGEHRGRLDPLGGGAEKMAIVRRRGAPLHLQGVAVVRRDAPAVGMLEPAQIAPALDEQGVRRAHQVPLDPGRSIRAQAVVATHGGPRGSG